MITNTMPSSAHTANAAAVATSEQDFKIPGTLNLALTFISSACMLGCLTLASSTDSVTILIACAAVFSFVGNTNFSLLHEAVHGVHQANRTLNEIAGIWCAGLFPTGFSFQRLCHLSHHANNRTDAEIFDMYYPTDKRWLKTLQFYTIFTGPYWLLPPLGSIVALVAPRLFMHQLFRSKDNPLVGPTGLGAMVRKFAAGAQSRRLRLEIAYSFAFQALCFYLLDWNIAGYLTCYFAFSLNWGALQYADHAWSPRDIRNGAWNLKVNPVTRWIFLNYHHHLVHHQYPNLPWLYLGRFIRDNDPRPTFLSIYKKMWRGPTPVTEPPPGQMTPAFNKLVWQPVSDNKLSEDF